MPLLNVVGGVFKESTRRIAWEAEKLGRVAAVQRDISRLEDQVRISKAELADVVLLLFQKGQINDRGVLQICVHIRDLDETIRKFKADLELVKAEEPPSVTVSQALSANVPAVVATVGTKCPQCGGNADRFCEVCGFEIPMSQGGLHEVPAV